GERRLGLGDADAVAGALELRPRLVGQPPRALRDPLGVFDPAEQQQALSTAQGLAELGEVLFAGRHHFARAVVAAEQILDLADDRLALGLPAHVLQLDEDLARALGELQALDVGAAFTREVPEQAQAVREALAIPQLLERGAGDLGVGARLFRAPHVAQGLRLPAVLERQRPSLQVALQEIQIGQGRERLARAVP